MKGASAFVFMRVQIEISRSRFIYFIIYKFFTRGKNFTFTLISQIFFFFLIYLLIVLVSELKKINNVNFSRYILSFHCILICLKRHAVLCVANRNAWFQLFCFQDFFLPRRYNRFILLLPFV